MATNLLPLLSVLVLVLTCLGLVIYGLVGRWTSVWIGLGCVGVGLVGAGLAWYAWTESRSLPWTIGYAVFAALAMAGAVRQGSGARRP